LAQSPDTVPPNGVLDVRGNGAINPQNLEGGRPRASPPSSASPSTRPGLSGWKEKEHAGDDECFTGAEGE